MDNSNTDTAKKRHRLTLEEQEVRAKANEAAAKQKLKEIQIKLRKKNRKARTRRLIQLGAVLESYFGKNLDPKEISDFFQALNTPPNVKNVPRRVLLKYDESIRIKKKYKKKDGTIGYYERGYVNSVKDAFDSFKNGEWDDFKAHNK